MGGRSTRVGLFLRGGSYAYQSEVVNGVDQECRARGADLYCLSGGNITLPDPRNFVYRLPGHRDLDAAIFVEGTMGAAEGDPRPRALVERLRALPVCTIGTKEPGIPCISIDNASGIRSLTRHLVQQHGRTRIAFVTGKGHEADQRLEGYRAGHRDLGLVADEQLVIGGDFTFAAGQAAVARLFGPGGSGCDAIVTANDWMALGALDALQTRRLRVPEDVALVGFDDIDEARFTTPPLTTVRQHPRQLGIQAVTLLLGGQTGAAEAGGDVMLETTPQVRQSCGCFRGARWGERQPRADTSDDDAASPDRWVRAAVADGPPADASLRSDWAELLVASLRLDLAGGDGVRFLSAVDDIVGEAAQLGNVTAWHDPLATLRREVARDLAGTPELPLVESIFERAHILIGDHAERAQGRRRLDTEATFRALAYLGTEVRMSLDRPSIARALATHLPGLRVRSCSVVVHDGERPPGVDDQVRLILSWDRERGLSSIDGGLGFRAGALLPDDFLPARRHVLMVQPLCFQSEALGWCLIEMEPPDLTLCEAIPEQISSSLKASALQERLVAEATKRERAERARLEHEIELAARIQTSILPKDRKVSRLDVSAVMIPATEVGGDYFDVLPFPNGGWLGIGDVAGHGLHSGLVMMMIQSIVAAITNDRSDASPAAVWTTLNAVLYDNVHTRLEREEHATLTLLRYEDSGRLVYAGAHQDILIHRAAEGRTERIETRGLWAGLAREVPAGITVDEELRLAPGDTMLLHTDGIPEAKNGEREMYGLERLRLALERNAHLGVDEVRDRIMTDARSFMAEQKDDLTLVVLRYS
jgi:DNA-binding LacI/PurR family transcriptional regulator/serine phosphatase RsbU (regulator of sigma subunit)